MINEGIYEKIKEVINKYDPIGLLKMGCPEDEYNSEIKMILDGLPKCKSVDEVTGLLYNTFVEAFEYGYSATDKETIKLIDPGGAGKKEDYRQAGEEIYSYL